MSFHYRVAEKFLESGKATPEACEDRLVITPHFVAVLDGATGSIMVDGKPGGWMAAEIVAKVIESLSPDATAFEFEAAATSALKPLAERWDGTLYRACTQAVVFSVARGEVWRIGDCHVRIDDKAYPGWKKIDEVMEQFRCALLRAAELVSPPKVEHLLHDKPWWQIVVSQAAFQNRDAGDPLDYGVLDGTPVPLKFVEVFDVRGASEVVLASDGFLEPPATLAEGLARLEAVKAQDPLMIHVVEGSRPFLPDRARFDDTTYVRLALER